MGALISLSSPASFLFFFLFPDRLSSPRQPLWAWSWALMTNLPSFAARHLDSFPPVLSDMPFFSVVWQMLTQSGPAVSLSQLWASLPSSRFSDVTLMSWNQSWLEHSHYRIWQTLPIKVFFFFQRVGLPIRWWVWSWPPGKRCLLSLLPGSFPSLLKLNQGGRSMVGWVRS